MGKVGSEAAIASENLPLREASAAGAGPAAQKLSPEALAKLSEIRARIASTFAKVTMALMATPRYRNQSLGDLDWLVLEPLMRDRIAIASAKPKEGMDAGQLVGVAYWAKVSDDVSRKIEEQIRAGSFPVRLKPEEWTSGETIWLLDVIAPNQKLATSVLASFGQVAKGAPVRIHPAVSRQVDPELLAKLGAKSA